MGVLSVLEVLLALDSPGVGLATHFFSHSQAETLAQTFEAMYNYMMSSYSRSSEMLELPMFFIDYLCIRQCAKGDFKPKAVEAIIDAIGRTVLVLEPLCTPTTLSRAWCVYEISCTLRSGASLAVASCSGANVGIVAKEMLEASETIKRNRTIDLAACNALKQEDKDMIIDHIKSMGSVELANRKVRKMVCDSIDDLVDAWK